MLGDEITAVNGESVDGAASTLKLIRSAVSAKKEVKLALKRPSSSSAPSSAAAEDLAAPAAAAVTEQAAAEQAAAEQAAAEQAAAEQAAAEQAAAEQAAAEQAAAEQAAAEQAAAEQAAAEQAAVEQAAAEQAAAKQAATEQAATEQAAAPVKSIEAAAEDGLLEVSLPASRKPLGIEFAAADDATTPRIHAFAKNARASGKPAQHSCPCRELRVRVV